MSDTTTQYTQDILRLGTFLEDRTYHSDNYIDCEVSICETAFILIELVRSNGIGSDVILDARLWCGRYHWQCGNV